MIIHLDADAFFASVEQAEDPSLRGKAMAVGGERRGIIASASYEARKRGVYTPMPSSQARKVCPELILVRGEFAKYRIYSKRMFDLAEEFTPHVERASIDEGYFDVSTNPRITAWAAAERLQQTIARELGITVSLGIGASKLISQIASKLRKPNALVEVPAGTEREFLAPLASHWLPGVGAKLGAQLREVGLLTIADVRDAPPTFLAQVAGSYAPQLQRYAHGIDPRPVISEPDDAKSYSQQETFDENVSDRAFVAKVLRGMADDLMSKLRRDGKAGRTITVRVRYADFTDDTHGHTLTTGTDLETDIYPLLPGLLRGAWRKSAPLRLTGLRLSNIVDPAVQTELKLDGDTARQSKQREAARLLDQLKARNLPLVRAGSLTREKPASRAGEEVRER
jgi:DNA polymerase-4